MDLQVGIRRHGRLNWQCHDPTHLAIRITEAILAYDILLPEEEHQIVSVECSEVQDWAFLKFPWVMPHGILGSYLKVPGITAEAATSSTSRSCFKLFSQRNVDSFRESLRPELVETADQSPL